MSGKNGKNIHLLGQLPPCNHMGYLVPLLFIPQTVDAIGPDKKVTKVQFFKTIEAICCRAGCGQIIRFGPPPGETPKTNPETEAMLHSEPQAPEQSKG